MRSVENLLDADLKELPVAMTIGSFDGVHHGHRALVERLLEVAQKKKAQSMVLTFDPHPAQVVGKARHFWRLFDVEDQREQFEFLGVDLFSVQPFTAEFAGLSADDFLNRFLFNVLDLRAVVVGYDFSFGSSKSGGFDLLAQRCEERGIYAESVDALLDDGEAVSSSRIRRAVEAGEVSEAESLLGRSFYLKGKVERGDQRGRQLGVPTANIVMDPETVPMSGVYATQTEHRGRLLPSVSNLGTRPTFEGSDQNRTYLETHLFDFSETIYGDEIRVHFKTFLREEQKFSGVDALVRQIHIDIRRAKEALS